MSAVMTPDDNVKPNVKRGYRRISPEHLAYARKRFAEFAATSTVRAELKAMGADVPHNALHYHWTLANKRAEARECAVSSDADPSDEAQQ